MMHFSNDPKLERGKIMLKQLLHSVLMLALLAAICASLPAAQAAPGALDPTFAGFGAGGDVTYQYLFPANMVLRPDGRVLMVMVHELTNDVKVKELKPDGKFYAEYVIPNPFQIKFVAKDIALQADGKIVVAGYADHSSANHSIMLVRLDGTGQLDPSFGEGGYVVTDFGQNQEEIAHKILIQPDGKIVVAGYVINANFNYDFAVVRYTVAGLPDATFGDGDGIVTVDLTNDSQDELAYDLALQSDGKLVVVGWAGDGSTSNFGLVRLETDGSLDDNSDGDGGFRGNGKFNQDFGGNERAYAVAIQPDGKIVVAGNDLSISRGIVARFLPNGNREVSGFNDHYFAPVGSYLKDLALQPDGKIVAIGRLNGDAAFFRLNSNGTPDTSFNNSGIKTINFGGPDEGQALALLPDGRILGLGTSNTSTIHGFLVRLWPDGTWDSGGKQTHGIISGYYELAYALAVQPDGKLLAAGELSSPGNTSSNAFVTRFLADGRVDTGFGAQGTIHPAYIFSQPTFRGARAIAVQPDGKIVMAGYSDIGSGFNADFLVARWHSNGAPDNNFGLGGFRPVGFPGNGDDYGTALALAPDGKIVVAGNVWNGSRQVWGVARLTSAGALDNTFDGDGLFTFGLDRSNSANAVAVQPDGKILVAGHSGGDFAVARLAANGALDPSFGQGGFAINDLSGTNVINALVLASNGWIYAAGSRLQNGGNEDMALAQYTPQGALASCPGGQTCNHWPTGTFFVNGGLTDVAYALDLRSDNQLVAAGCTEQRFAAVQVRTDGAPTPLSFNADFVGHQDCARAVKFIGWNNIVLAGHQNLHPMARDWNIALARFETTGNNTVPPPTLPPPPTSNVYPVYLPVIMH
jgi:uncharacterized delta-60 repeat protein